MNPARGLTGRTETTQDDALAMLPALSDNPVYRNIIAAFAAQQQKGLEKYGTNIDTSTLSMLQWIEHAMQESIDHLVYLECIRQKLIEENR